MLAIKFDVSFNSAGQSLVSKPANKMAKTTPGNPATEVGQYTPKEYAGNGPRVRRRRGLRNRNE